MNRIRGMLEWFGLVCLIAIGIMLVVFVTWRLADMEEMRSYSKDNAVRLDRITRVLEDGKWKLDPATGEIRFVQPEGK